MKSKILTACCSLCGNESGYDEQSLKGSTWNINGCEQILCCNCEDELLKKIAKGRGITINYGDGGEVWKVKIRKGIMIDHPNKNKIFQIVDKYLMSDQRDEVMDLIEGCD